MFRDDITLRDTIDNQKSWNYTREDIKGLEELPKQWYIFIPIVGPFLLSKWLNKHVHENNMNFLKKVVSANPRMNWTVKSFCNFFAKCSLVFDLIILLLGIFLGLQFHFDIAHFLLGPIPLWGMTVIFMGVIYAVELLIMWKAPAVIMRNITEIKNRPEKI